MFIGSAPGLYTRINVSWLLSIDSLTRLGDYWKFLLNDFLTQDFAKIVFYCFILINIRFRVKTPFTNILAKFLETFGYFLFQHLVTLSTGRYFLWNKLNNMERNVFGLNLLQKLLKDILGSGCGSCFWHKRNEVQIQ